MKPLIPADSHPSAPNRAYLKRFTKPLKERKGSLDDGNENSVYPGARLKHPVDSAPKMKRDAHRHFLFCHASVLP